MRVRQAEPADLEAMARIDSALGEGSPRWGEVRDLIARCGCLLCEDVTSDGRATVVGYACVLPRHFFGRDFITLLIVAEPWRRRGVGTQLLNAAIARAATTTVFTSTNASNRPMRELLSRGHWSVSGKLEGLDEGDPEIVYFRPAG